MNTNLDRYKQDLVRLNKTGFNLYCAMQRLCFKDEFDKLYKKEYGEGFDDFVKGLPNFNTKYQGWYSEALALIGQILPDRKSNFVSLYEIPKGRKDLDHGNYVISDFLVGLIATRYGEEKTGISSALPKFEQQRAIVKAASDRFDSSLFDIRSLVQADLFDGELDAAKELARHKFFRAAGALAGVILEKHLQEVCRKHNLTIPKKNGIAVLNELLKAADVIETSQWRFITLMGDLRNKCDHNRDEEPTKENISDLIDGVNKIMKTVM